MRSVKIIHHKQLEQQEPEISSRTDMVKYGRELRFVVIGAEAIDSKRDVDKISGDRKWIKENAQIMIIQHVQHWNAAVRNCKFAASE